MKKIICMILILMLSATMVFGYADGGSDIVSRAESWVGRADYVWGACQPGAFDCSGFVSYCVTGTYARIGTTYTFLTWPEVSDPQPGDVCVNTGHCGIYVGGGQMIHAATEGVGVIYSPVQRGMIFVRYPGSGGGVDPLYPDTGDRTDPFLWAALLMMSLGLVVASLKLRRRER